MAEWPSRESSGNTAYIQGLYKHPALAFARAWEYGPLSPKKFKKTVWEQSCRLDMIASCCESSDTMCKICKIMIASNKQERKGAHTSRSYTNAQAASHARPLSHCYQVRLSVNIGRWVSTFRIDERHSESPRDGSLLCRYQQGTASSVGRRQLPYGVVNEPRQTDASHQLHDLCRALVLASACMHNTSTYCTV